MWFSLRLSMHFLRICLQCDCLVSKTQWHKYINLYEYYSSYIYCTQEFVMTNNNDNDKYWF